MDPFRVSLRPSTKTAEDSVEYFIYPFPDVKNVSPELSDVLATAMNLTQGYLWHNQTFRLQKKEFPTPHFYGCTNFGENLEDEWFIVYLLFELSKVYANLIIKVVDADGEFLLVEMAEKLPDWCDPETTNNRVFIRRGQIHIIPLPEACALFPLSIIRPYDGAELVHRYPQQSMASDFVAQPLDQRLSSYPSCIPSQYHYAHAYLPMSLALIIDNSPVIMAQALHALVQRDKTHTQVCRTLPHFTKEIEGNELVLRCLRFTKHLYAMIVKHSMVPHKQSSWKIHDKQNDKAMLLGFKVSCGFEILLSQCTNLTNGHGKDNSICKEFITSLHNKGFFKGEMEGSQKYMQLLSQAQRFYNDSCSNKSGPTAIECVNDLYEKYKDFDEETVNRLKSEKLRKEDDESWLNVSAAEIDAYLQDGDAEKLLSNGDLPGPKCSSSSEDPNSEKKPTAPPRKKKKNKNKSYKKKMRDKVVHFVDDTSSGLNGVIVNDSLRYNKDVPIDFNPKKFGTAVSKMLELDIPTNDNGDSSDMDSYEEEDMNIDLNEKKATEMKEWKSTMNDYMKKMDKELESTSIGKSFEKMDRPNNLGGQIPKGQRSKSRSPGEDSIDFEDDEFTPVDIDRNLVKNMLTGYYTEARMSQPGPATSFLTGLKANPSATGADLLDSDDDPDIF